LIASCSNKEVSAHEGIGIVEDHHKKFNILMSQTCTFIRQRTVSVASIVSTTTTIVKNRRRRRKSNINEDLEGNQH